MKVFRSARFLLIAFALALVPASSFAGVFISVNIAPPVLPVYEQPVCPQEGWMWTPGYWGYGDGGYYWIPGAWVPAPEPGMLWTPPYWGWTSGAYIFHEGYWGPHVGYYGGVNYGFGFMGIGFVGGDWRGGHFFYNTAIVHIGGGFHNVYRNETIIHNTTIINNNHVAYSGGPGGINHPPSAQERQFSAEHHVAPSAMQTQHMQAAAHDPQQRFNANHGRPGTMASARPMAAANHSAVRGPEGGANRGPQGGANRGAEGARPEAHNAPGARPAESHAAPAARPQSHAAPAARQESHPAARPQSHPSEKPHGR